MSQQFPQGCDPRFNAPQNPFNQQSQQNGYQQQPPQQNFQQNPYGQQPPQQYSQGQGYPQQGYGNPNPYAQSQYQQPYNNGYPQQYQQPVYNVQTPVKLPKTPRQKGAKAGLFIGLGIVLSLLLL